MFQNGNMFKININSYFHNYLLDVTDTKIYKSKQITPKKTHKRICIVKFDNKVLEVFDFDFQKSSSNY